MAGTLARLVGTSGEIATKSPFPAAEYGEVPLMLVADTRANTCLPHASENGGVVRVLISTVHLCASRTAATDPSHSVVSLYVNPSSF